MGLFIVIILSCVRYLTHYIKGGGLFFSNYSLLLSFHNLNWRCLIAIIILGTPCNISTHPWSQWESKISLQPLISSLYNMEVSSPYL